MSSTRVTPDHEGHPDRHEHHHTDRGISDVPPRNDALDEAAGYDEGERREFEERAERVEERLHALDQDEPDEALRPRHHDPDREHTTADDDVRRDETTETTSVGTNREDREDDGLDDRDRAAHGDEGPQDTFGRDEEETRRKQEEFAAEHDPAQHDVQAGEEFRQRGDMIADGDHTLVVDGQGEYNRAGHADALTDGITATQDQDENSAVSSSSEDDAPRAAVQDEDRRNALHRDPHRENGENGVGGEALQVPATGTQETPVPSTRRESTLQQVEDGGYGVGSARPIEGGLIPLGHHVKAWEDTKTYVLPTHPRYDDAQPHVWFLDADAAERNGFRAAGH